MVQSIGWAATVVAFVVGAIIAFRAHDDEIASREAVAVRAIERARQTAEDQVERFKLIAEPKDWLARATHVRLVVHTSDDRSIEGFVAEVSDDGVLMRAAKLLQRPPVDLAGDVWIPRGKVVFAQTVPETAD